jgi:hypothetical protein
LIAADAHKQRSVPGAEWEAKEDAGRSVQEYLAVLDDAAFGAASPVTPTFISPSDPAAQWSGAHKGHAFFAYATNYLIDTDHGVILDVEATRAIRRRRSEYLARCSTDGEPLRLATWLSGGGQCLRFRRQSRVVGQGEEIAPHIPVFDKSMRTDGTFSRSDFMGRRE